jgi:WD40 repeat protein
MESYDVFLCHNSLEKPAVREIHEVLRNQRGLTAYLDESVLIGGQAWEQNIAGALAQSRSLAVMLGAHGWGKYQLEGELIPALARRVQDTAFRVIPVLMPGFDEQMLLVRREVEDLFVKTMWVDLREGFDDVRMKLLEAAVRGEQAFPEGRPELTVARVRFDAARWAVTRREASLLYGGALLQEAIALLEARHASAPALTHEFIAAGRAYQNEQIGRRLAGAARALLTDPEQVELAAALAMEAAKRHVTAEAVEVLRSASTRLARVIASVELPADLTAVTSAGDTTVFGCASGQVIVRAPGGERLLETSHQGRITALAFDPACRWFASGGVDGRVRIWEASSGQLLRTFELGEPIDSLHAEAGTAGTKLLAHSSDVASMGHVKLWNVDADWDDSWRWAPNAAQAAVLDSRADRVMLAWGSAVGVATADTGRMLKPMLLDSQLSVRSIAAHPTRPAFAIIVSDGMLWTGTLGADGVAEMTKVMPMSPISTVRFSPGGRWLAAHDPARLHVWDLEAGGAPLLFPYQKLFGVDAIFSPDDRRVGILSTETGTFTVWDLRERTQIYSTKLAANSPVQFIDARRFACMSEPGRAKLCELPSLDSARWTHNPMLARALAFSPDERWLRWVGAYSQSGVFEFGGGQWLDQSFFVADVTTGEWQQIDLKHRYVRAAFHPTNAMAVLCDGDDTILLGFDHTVSAADPDPEPDASWFDTDPDFTERKRRSLEHPVVSAAVQARGYVDAFPSRSGRWLVVGHDRNAASLWDLEQGVEVCSLTGRGKIDRAAFDRGETRVAFGDENGGIAIYSTAGVEQMRLRHADAIIDLAFSPRGTYLAASSADTCLRLWVIDAVILAGQLRALTQREMTDDDWSAYFASVPR